MVEEEVDALRAVLSASRGEGCACSSRNLVDGEEVEEPSRTFAIMCFGVVVLWRILPREKKKTPART